MYIEYACYDEYNRNKIRDNVFNALDKGVGGISVHSAFLSQIAEILPHGITLSCPIDWPCGVENTSIRNHAVLNAIHQGANAIDLVSHVIFPIHDLNTKYIPDIQSNLDICKDHGVSLRIMLEYRIIDDSQLVDVCHIMHTMGIEYLFPSTGYRIDNCIDNLLISHRIQNAFGIFCITNGNLYQLDHFTHIKNAHIYGTRFHNINSVNRILTGV